MHWNQFLPNIVTSSILNIACWERLWGCRYWFWTAWILLVLCCRIWSCRRHGMGSSARILAGMEWRIPRNRVLIVHGSCRVWTTCCFAVVAKNGCSWNSVTSSAAAKGGHLSVLQWTRANRCDCDERTCSFAAGQTRRGSSVLWLIKRKFFTLRHRQPQNNSKMCLAARPFTHIIQSLPFYFSHIRPCVLLCGESDVWKYNLAWLSGGLDVHALIQNKATMMIFLRNCT
jgi:hypothetical protein